MTKVIAVIMAVFTWFGAVLNPGWSKIEGVYGDVEERIQTVFDEGEFIMGENDLVVAPYGDDRNAGTPEAPLKTLEKAKELLKANASADSATVWFREGTYTINNVVEFTSKDKDNVLYRSYPNEKVYFSGSRAITGWSETTINGVKAFVTDVKVDSDDDYFRSLFKGDKRLSRSTYPKEGMFKVADPSESEGIAGSHAPDFFTHSVAFYAKTNEILNFANASDVEVKVMHFWCDEHLPVHSVDAATGRVETTKPSAMRIRVDDNFIFENVRETLTLPGEWYLDRAEDKLYYIPEAGDTVENTVLQAGVNEQLFTFNGVENIAFQGIDFVNTDWDYVDGKHTGNPFPATHPLYKNVKYGTDHPQAAFEVPAAIYIVASKGIDFTDCRFENISYTAVKFDKGTQDCDVTSCYFNGIGANAIFIHGDFVMPATTKNINVTDCHIAYYGRIFNNAIGILLTHAYDCDLKYNEIHDGWYTGVSVGWNWGYADHPTDKIDISNNLIYNIGNGWLSDMGGIYTLGVQPETVISGNVIYNVGCDEGAYGYGGWGIYLDEGSSEMLVENNLVYDCSSETFHQHYGRDNIVRNNIFAFGGEGAFIITKNEEHNSLTLTNNILVVDDATIYAFDTERDWFIDDSNLYWDYKRGRNVYSGHTTKLFDRKSLVILTAQGYYNNAVYEDPLFKDAENRDFTLAENSPALETGFVPFAYDAGTLTKF
ncbi:MAG: right-handed parallel beta-helix repeat-containing protein [Acutalibacteraceae bacterium]|nr:right-handed parallel beta-helix repeat-containing protein [Acutalibacteraceae bacterium]